MSTKEYPDHDHSQEGFALFVPREIITTSEETKIVFTEIATSPEILERAEEILLDQLADQGFIAEIQESGNKSTFGLSGSWNAPWNPEGPKKNWRVDPPEDIHNN